MGVVSSPSLGPIGVDGVGFTIAKSMRVKMLASSSFIQTLNGNGDWHLTINFYDFQTKELLHKEIFR